MIRILIELWPALIPATIFGIWYFRAVGQYKRSDDPKVYDVFLEKKKKYMFYTLVSSSILVIAMLLYFAFSQPATPHIEIENDQVDAR